MKKLNKTKQLAEDLEFARRTKEAWEEYNRGEFISQDSKEFLKDLKEWVNNC